MRVLLVEDDIGQADAADRALTPFGYELIRFHDGERAIKYMKSNGVDIVILDWQLPKVSGVEVLHWIRKSLGPDIPVLFLSNKVLEIDIVLALEAGADDYLVKPFRVAELGARVNVLSRRLQRGDEAERIFHVGEYVLDVGERSIRHRNELIPLTTKEFDLLALFFRNVGRTLSRAVIETSIWGHQLEVASRTLDTHVYRLRQKLHLSPRNGVRLRSVYTHGFRMDHLPLIESSTPDVQSDPRLNPSVESRKLYLKIRQSELSHSNDETSSDCVGHRDLMI